MLSLLNKIHILYDDLHQHLNFCSRASNYAILIFDLPSILSQYYSYTHTSL